jgi:5-(carboxyamino)imidazole ribonucleotide synthase
MIDLSLSNPLLTDRSLDTDPPTAALPNAALPNAALSSAALPTAASTDLTAPMLISPIAASPIAASPIAASPIATSPIATSLDVPVIPYRRVGIIGGGQLAWMMERAVQKLGLELRVQTPSLQDPAVAIAQATILAPIQDVAATAQLAAQSEVITFENEFVDLARLADLAERSGVRFAPSLASLQPLLDKADQRTYLQSIGLPTPQFLSLANIPTADRPTWTNPLGFPVVLKARRLGYDGQGTYIVQTEAELRSLLDDRGFEPFLLEEFVPFSQELAILVARSASGEIVCYPLVETQQQQQVCRWVLAPAIVAESVAIAAQALAQTFVESLGGVGIFGIELFLAPGDRLLVNEIAPRTHNSGHYSLDACETSQFEQQLRAVCNFPLGSSAMTCPGAIMVNILGYESAEDDYPEQRQSLAQLPNAQLYWYSKSQSRPGRKLGHVTGLLNQIDPEARRQAARAFVESVDAIWGG